jgi:hypothetical protein
MPSFSCKHQFIVVNLVNGRDAKNFEKCFSVNLKMCVRIQDEPTYDVSFCNLQQLQQQR